MWAVPYAALLLFAGGLDVYGTVVAETRVGKMPLQADQEFREREFVAGLIIPAGVLELRQPDFALELGYGARFYWQDPSTPGRSPGRPLILHLAHFDGQTTVTERVTLGLHLLGSQGAVDYSLLPQVVGPSQAMLPPTALNIRTGSGIADIAVRASRLWLLGFAARIEYRQALQDTATMPDSNAQPAFPTQTVVSGEPSAKLRLSRSDDLIFSGTVVYGDYSGGIQVLTVAPKVSWRTRPEPHSQLELSFGIAVGHDLGPLAVVVRTQAPIAGAGAATGSKVGSAVSPIGGVVFEETGWRVNARPVHVSAAALVEYLVDPFLQLAGPRGTISGRVLLGLQPTWTIGAEASLATNLRSTALVGDPDETVIFASIPVRHPLSPYLLAEFGGRLTERAPGFAAQRFVLHQQQIWLYLMLAATTRGTRASATP